MSKSKRHFFLAAIGLSAVLILLATALQTGYENTPYATQDSKGNPLGFNEPITAELYGILLRNVDWDGFLEQLGWYGILCLAMHGIGFVAVGLSHESRSTWRKAFFAAQLLLFPLGWLGILVVPLWIFFAVIGKLDGESIVDLPLNWLFAAGWIVVSFYLAVIEYRSSHLPKLQTA